MAMLTYDMDTSPGDLVNRAAKLFAQALYQRIAPHGISKGQWPFLMLLWDEDGLSQKELSTRRGIKEATTVRALDRMERDGLVQRVRDTKDRRRTNIFLTDKGRGLQPSLIPFTTEVNSLATADYSPEETEVFLSLVKRIIVNLEKDQANRDAG